MSKGIALYSSIARHTDDFTMYVMAMDRKCEEILKTLNFSHMVVECLDDNMSPELLKAKGNRSRAEFCWTCGSYITNFFLLKYDLPDITYLDSDLMFFSSPWPIFKELMDKNASVGLSPHYIKYNASGKYCVQYVYFKNDKDGRSALLWWRNECLKWCYSKMDNGKYGDQLYLESMPRMFNNVYEIEHKGHGMANWNIIGREIHKNYFIEKGLKYEFIFFHYSGFNVFVKERKLNIRANFLMTNEIKHYFLIPYANLMRKVYENYLNEEIDDVVIYKGYGIFRSCIIFCNYQLSRFNIYRWLSKQLVLARYAVRQSPYSEIPKN